MRLNIGTGDKTFYINLIPSPFSFFPLLFSCCENRSWQAAVFAFSVILTSEMFCRGGSLTLPCNMDLYFSAADMVKLTLRHKNTEFLTITSYELNIYPLFSLIFTSYNKAIQRMKREDAS